MINLLVGAPGGGKSYEAVVYHVLAALAKGRKVITNLALKVEAFAAIDPGYADLIELRKCTVALRPVEAEQTKAQSRFMSRLGLDKPRTWNGAAFSHVEDYGDPWRHEKSGVGPLYVIDECHISLPKTGTPVAVEEWYSLHRHEFADVLLISQSYGKLNAAVRDLVQIVYRVRKNIALGSSGTYTRKVQDGIRGAEVNAAVRRYEKRYFPLYVSHTRSGVGAEAGAEDIIPIWRNWSVYGVGACAVVFAGLWMVNGNPFRMFWGPHVKAVPVVSSPEPGRQVRLQGIGHAVKGGPGAVAAGPESVAPATVSKAAVWPYGNLQLHVGGFLRSARRTILLVVFSQNGQRVFSQTGGELEASGYKLTALNDCLVRVEWEKLAQFITCDAPSVGIGSAYNKPVPTETAAADSVPAKR